DHTRSSSRETLQGGHERRQPGRLVPGRYNYVVGAALVGHENVTVLVPIRHEDHLLEERLHRLLEASRSVRGRLLLALDAGAGGALVAARSFASTAPDVELHITQAPGKFSAVHDSLARVSDGIV